MDAKQAIETLSQRGDIIAKQLGVDEGAGWRDNTGTAHLIVRGALQSLERIKDGAHSKDDANIAIGTVGFAGKSPAGFLLSDTSKVAEIAKNILNTEMSGGALGEATTAEGLNLLKSNLDSFTNDIVGSAKQVDADPSLIAFAGALEVANSHYQSFDFGFAVQPEPSSGAPAPKKNI